MVVEKVTFIIVTITVAIYRCPKINARFEFAAICAAKRWQP